MSYEANFTAGEIWQDIWNAVERELHQIGAEMVKDVVRELNKQNIDFDGDLRKSITRTIRAIGTQWRMIVAPTVRHGEYVFTGTKPHWPPYQSIRNWTRKKLGISPTATFQKQVSFQANGRSVNFTAKANKLESVTRAIMHKIATEGTKGQDYLTPVFDKWEKEIPERLERVATEAADAG